MSKKRKTKKQKVLAATRQDFSSAITFRNPSEDKQEIRIEIPQSFSATENVPLKKHNNYSYVAADMRKTLAITALLVPINIVFYFILKAKIINFSGILF